MKPETAAHLDKALRCLGNANAEMAAAAFQPSLIDDAARNAYYAAFHAAKALVFQQTGKVQKSHGGVHSEFHNLVRADPTVDSAMLTFLTRAYDFKRIADYDIGPAGQITMKSAIAAVEEAARFVEMIRTLIP